MKTKYSLILIMLCLIGMLSAQATSLFISEYVEGSSFNKYIEVFNGTGAAVDLSGYKLRMYANGAATPNSDIALSGMLANNSCAVFQHSQAALTLPNGVTGTNCAAVNYNGNDAFALFSISSATNIDIIGVIGENPGTTPAHGWTIAGVTDATLNHTIVRKANVSGGNTNWATGAGTNADDSQWIVYDNDTATYLGAHTFTGGTTDPIIIVSNPNSAVTWYVGQSYNITWSSSNITGNVQIELSDNGAFTTLVDNTENDGSWTWDIPMAQTLGTQYKVKISNIGVTVSDMSDNFFTLAQPTPAANIAQLRASAADGTTVYRLSGEAILTFKQAYRSQKFIQDASAAVLIDDLSGIITTGYTVGDGITGITGKLSEYAGMLQFVPISNPGAATSTGNVLMPQIITLNDLTTNFEAYESELVKINNCSFTNPTGNFANGTIYPINDASGTYGFRTTFYDMDYIGSPMPTTPKNIIGIPTSRLETEVVTCFFTARNAADFQTPTAQTAAPTFNPVAGSYSAPQNVTISSVTPDAVVHYTIDGSTPTNESTVFVNPILVSETTTIKAIAIATGMPASDVSEATYTIVVANDDPVNNSPVLLVGNHPNPFNDNTTISVKSRYTQPVVIEIYNLKGQLIRTLKTDVKAQSENSINWNATDESGKRVAAGMYLFNIKGSSSSSSQKMILLK